MQTFTAEKSFKGEKKNLAKIREFIKTNLQKTLLTSQDIFRIKLAVDEACSNIIIHNYRENSKKKIDIILKVENKKISVLIKDEGEKFNPLDITDPDLEKVIKEYRQNGLGIYLIRRLVDEIIYHTVKDKGNTLELIKYI